MKIELQDPAQDENDEKKPKFGQSEERAIISLAFDQPEYFSSIIPFLKVDYFTLYEARFIFTLIKYYFDKHAIILSRNMCLDIANETLNADDPHEDVLSLVNRVSDPRELPIIRDKLHEWAKSRAYGQLYSQEALLAHEQGDYQKIEEILDSARRIVDIGNQCHFFFDEIDPLFVEEKAEKLTTGFPRLDSIINMGGPQRKEVFVFMAPTGVGKSIALSNAAIANIKTGKNVLIVTLEMTYQKYGLRLLGGFTDLWISKRHNPEIQSNMKQQIKTIKETYGSELVIVEFPPDDVSVDAIHATLDMIRKVHGVNIDVVVIDYLELLLSRVATNNKEDYIRQKRVATEIARFAKKENVLVFTATQTNRSGNEGEDKKGEATLIDINKVAESYGKTMPMDYLVSINQTRQEYDSGRIDPKNEMSPVVNARCRLYVVKNRNGLKFQAVEGVINYETMKMRDYV